MVQIRGTEIRKVVFWLDGKKKSTLTRPNRGTGYMLRVDPRKLDLGMHRVMATTSFTAASRTKARTTRVVFSRCALRAVSPQFTG